MFSRPDIPFHRNHIPRPDSFASFSHLKDISSRLSYFPDIEIGLLIGYNCSKASVPLQVVCGSNISEPYAVQTPLGWTIIGSTSHSNIPLPLPQSSSMPVHSSSLPESSKVNCSMKPKKPLQHKASSLLIRAHSCSIYSSQMHRPPSTNLIFSNKSKFLPRRKFDPRSSVQVPNNISSTKNFQCICDGTTL